MQTLQNAVMIILWHWRALKETQGTFDYIAVENASECSIVRIDDSGEKDQIADNIKEQLDVALKNKSKVLLLMHNNSLDRECFRQLENEYKTVKINYFGGGKEYIYFNPVTDTGLLNQFDDFIRNELLKWKDPETGETKREIKNMVIPLEEPPGGFMIPRKYFHDVWQYYTYQPTRTAFELKEKLFIYLVGNEFGKSEKRVLPVLLQQDQSILGSLLSSFLDTSLTSNRIKEIYGKDEIVLSYEKLCEYIKTTPVGHRNYLQHLRSYFSNLLQLIPEKIYG
ncbi:MAG: hypothetical protein JNK77_18525 [Saprospiraceae bacterium]|nr:hypothetical protein [Saprospiraceae bacterium]